LKTADKSFMTKKEVIIKTAPVTQQRNARKSPPENGKKLAPLGQKTENCRRKREKKGTK